MKLLSATNYSISLLARQRSSQLGMAAFITCWAQTWALQLRESVCRGFLRPFTFVIVRTVCIKSLSLMHIWSVYVIQVQSFLEKKQHSLVKSVLLSVYTHGYFVKMWLKFRQDLCCCFCLCNSMSSTCEKCCKYRSWHLDCIRMWDENAIMLIEKTFVFLRD